MVLFKLFNSGDHLYFIVVGPSLSQNGEDNLLFSTSSDVVMPEDILLEDKWRLTTLFGVFLAHIQGENTLYPFKYHEINNYKG